MTDFEKALDSINEACGRYDLPYMLIGGLAATVYGVARATQDIDIVVVVEFEEKERVLEAFKSSFESRVDHPLAFVERHFVLPLRHKTSGVNVDVSLGFSEFERGAVGRCRDKKVGKVALSCCSLEDLLLFKLVASRPIDLMDVQELVGLYWHELDKEYLRTVATRFREVERSDILEELERFLRKAN